MEDNVQKRFVEFILAVVKRPAMFHVSKVEDIWIMTLAYQHALLGNENKTINDILSGFRTYVNKHYKTTSDHSWERLIRFHCASESHSIELFSTLFNEYLSK